MIQGIPPTEVWIYWPTLWKHIHKAMVRTKLVDYYSELDVKERITKGTWQVWVTWKSIGEIETVTVTSIELYSTGRREFMIWFVGGPIKRILKEWWEYMVGLGRAQRCHAIAGAGRPGWPKVIENIHPHKVDVDLMFVTRID